MEAINLDGDEASDGLLALVIAVVELLIEALEGEAIRRMESGSLTDEEIERLGSQLAALHEEVDRLKADTELEDDVSQLRTSLSDLVEDAIERVDDEPHPGFAFLDDANTPSPEHSEPPDQPAQPDQSPTSSEGEE
ncbi:gas vesicle protein K [Halohasta salina]|uniref:gas vesicle protein K n=1 Tax=Halohasta salina TaxID=2961621 RepID=UPI0020A5E74B|nr:gas vesicle protein K [Halohasta salina]